MRTLSRIVFVIVLSAAIGCDSGTPTQPMPSRQPPTQPGPGLQPGSAPVAQQFEVTGIVTDQQGTPLAGALVTMGLYNVAYPNWPTTVTDASGSYRISFDAWAHPSNFVARAQINVAGYEEYWRSLRTDGRTTLVENFQLPGITRITAGESIVVSVVTDPGECPGDWDGVACAIVRVAALKPGRLTIEVSSETTTGRPTVEVHDRWGNPITLPVAAGDELVVKFGVGPDTSATQRFLLKTSIEED